QRAPLRARFRGTPPRVREGKASRVLHSPSCRAVDRRARAPTRDPGGPAPPWPPRARGRRGSPPCGSRLGPRRGSAPEWEAPATAWSSSRRSAALSARWLVDGDAGRVFPQANQGGHVVLAHPPRARLEEALLGDRAEEQGHVRGLRLVVD